MLSDDLDDSQTPGSEFCAVIPVIMANTYFITYRDDVSFHLWRVSVLLCFVHMSISLMLPPSAQGFFQGHHLIFPLGNQPSSTPNSWGVFPPLFPGIDKWSVPDQWHSVVGLWSQWKDRCVLGVAHCASHVEATCLHNKDVQEESTVTDRKAKPRWLNPNSWLQPCLNSDGPRIFSYMNWWTFYVLGPHNSILWPLAPCDF